MMILVMIMMVRRTTVAAFLFRCGVHLFFASEMATEMPLVYVLLTLKYH